MSIALFFLAFAFSESSRTERIVRKILITQLFLTIVASIFYSIKFGIERNYLFEVAAITINWLIIIAIGILTGLFFKKELEEIRVKL